MHEDIRSAVRQMCRDFPDEYWYEHDQSHEFPWDFYNAVAKAGWLGITIPEEYGGGGLGVTEAAIVEQEIAASGAGMNGCSAVHIGIFGFEPLIKYGSEDLKQRFLPRVTSGDLHISFAVTEPDAGTDTTNITTSRRRSTAATSSRARRCGSPRRRRPNAPPLPDDAQGAGNEEDRRADAAVRAHGP